MFYSYLFFLISLVVQNSFNCQFEQVNKTSQLLKEIKTNKKIRKKNKKKKMKKTNEQKLEQNELNRNRNEKDRIKTEKRYI